MRKFLKRLSRWDKLLLVLVGLYLLLWPLEPLSSLVYGLRVLLQALLYIVGGVLLVRFTYRLVRALTRRFLWRVRHRMAAVFFFIGVVPLGLALLLGAVGVVLVFGPTAAYMVTSQVDKRAEALYATADSLAWELRAATPERRLDIGRRFITDARERYPGLLILFQSPEGPLSVPSDFRLDTPPASLANYRGLVRRQGVLYLAAYAEFEPGAPSLLLMAPLTEEYLQDLAPGLGVVEPATGLAPTRAELARLTPEPSAAAQPAAAVETDPDSPRMRRVLRSLPPPAHAFDWPLPWRAQAEVLVWETGGVAQEQAFVLLTRASAVVRVLFQNQSAEMRQMTRYLSYILGGLFAFAVLLSSIVAVSLTRTITAAINELYVGTQHVNRADFSHRIPVGGYTQLTELARSFNSMTASIGRLIVDQKEKQRLESELAIASEVQTQLFPRSAPRLTSLEVLGVCRAARSVSGDFYDYVKLSDDRLALCFGDVAGKGISAALVMAAVHSSVRTSLGSLEGEPNLADAAARLVAKTNRQLCEGTAPEKFATLFFGLYDQPSGDLVYVNAGHLPPVLLRHGQAMRLDVTGMVVGCFPEAPYEASVVRLQPGDLIAAFTDGVTEPENPYEEQFGEERLAEALVRDADRPLDEIIQTVMREVDDWSGQQEELTDDMTMLAARRI